MNYEQIMVGRFSLIAAQHHLAQQFLHYDAEGKPVLQDEAARQAFSIIDAALQSLAHEFVAKRAQRRRAA